MDWAQRKAALVADSAGRTIERGYVYGSSIAEKVGNPLEDYMDEWNDVAARVDEFTGHSILTSQQLSKVRPLMSWNNELHHTVAKLRLEGERNIHKKLLYNVFTSAVRRVPEYAEDCRSSVDVTPWEATGTPLLGDRTSSSEPCLCGVVGVEFAGINGRFYLNKDLADHPQAKSVVVYIVGSAMSSLDSLAHKVRPNPNLARRRRYLRTANHGPGVPDATLQGGECGDLCLGVPEVRVQSSHRIDHTARRHP